MASKKQLIGILIINNPHIIEYDSIIAKSNILTQEINFLVTFL